MAYICTTASDPARRDAARTPGSFSLALPLGPTLDGCVPTFQVGWELGGYQSIAYGGPIGSFEPLVDRENEIE